jgi:hypothetical protein
MDGSNMDPRLVSWEFRISRNDNLMHFWRNTDSETIRHSLERGLHSVWVVRLSTALQFKH